jgi:methylamine---glutamate N-methyltransferase subunit A
MCGIVGYLDKTGTKNQRLGKTLLGMLNALACRGPDSAGVALFGPSRPNQLIARVKIGSNGDGAKRAIEIKMLAQRFGAEEFAQKNEYLRFVFQDTVDLKPFISSIEGVARDVEIVSIGQRLEIVKQVGSPARLEESFAISGFQGSHGIGHTRLSTESIVDLSHSQPFWAHGSRDLAIAHNGLSSAASTL